MRKFRYGDKVTGIADGWQISWRPRARDQRVEGIIITAANNDPKLLAEGNVEIRTTEGKRYWIRDTELLSAYKPQVVEYTITVTTTGSFRREPERVDVYKAIGAALARVNIPGSTVDVKIKLEKG